MNDPADSPIAVLRTRLPYTDRRSLSQAWRSALHLSSDDATTSDLPRRAWTSSAAVAVRANPEPPPARDGSASRVVPRVMPRVARALDTGAATATGASVARARSVDAPSVARAAAAFERARSYPPFQTSLSIGLDGARVQLLLRREGGTLHVVALCTAGNVDLVRRALAHADAHLRRSGETVRASVRLAELAG